MAKLNKLTKAQEVQIERFRDEWLRHGLACGDGDKTEAERGVRLAYEAAGLAAPRIIVWLDSPLQGAYGAEILRLLGERTKDFPGAQVWDQVGAQVGAQVRDQVWAKVWDQTWDQVRNQVGDQVRDQVRRAAYGQHDANWLAFYDFFGRACGLDALQRLAGLTLTAQHAGWWWPFRGAAILTRRHTLVRRDERNRLHCATGPALLYPDGFAVYAWRGTRIPREWIESPAQVDPSLALTWHNVEQRRCLAEILGWGKVIAALNPTTVDADPDPQIGTLLRCDLPDSPGEQFLQVRCGTWSAENQHRTFVLPVPPDMRTARQANAWTYGLEPIELAPEART